MLCRSCGKQIPDGTGRCPYCGAILTRARPQPVRPQNPGRPPVQPQGLPVQPQPPAKPPKKRNTALRVFIVLIALLLVAAGVFAAVHVLHKDPSGGEEPTGNTSAPSSSLPADPSDTADAEDETYADVPRVTVAREEEAADTATVSGMITRVTDALNAGDRTALSDVLADDDLLLAVMVSADEEDADAWKSESGDFDAAAMLEFFRPVCMSGFDYIQGGKLEIAFGDETAAYDFGAGHASALPLNGVIRTLMTDTEIEGETFTSVASGRSYHIQKAVRATIGNDEELTVELIAVDDAWKVLMVIPTDLNAFERD